jgi:arylsulfatase A-like enzyme
MALVICQCALAAGKPPNILYIFTDDQSHRTVSCYEEARPWAKTPHIDALAASGMRFTTCYTGTWCQPSRASALTGLLQHGIQTLEITDYPMASYDPEQLPFFPTIFRQNGYATACIGKWHLGKDVGHGRDWDYSVIWDRGHNNGARNAGAYYDKTLVRTNGGEREPLGGYSTDRFTELAVDYIKQQQDAAKPWYLWLCYGGVHSPYTPAVRHADAYREAPASKVPADIFGPRSGKPEHLRMHTRWKKDENGEPRGYDAAVKKYHRAVRSLDDGVGALVAALRESGQLENTVIIFTSDQGFAWGQHGMKEKWAPYDANLCAPLVFSAPGRIRPGSVCREPVSGVDITRTIHSLAGIEPAWKMHGRDLLGLLEESEASLDRPMLMINTTYAYGERVADVLQRNACEEFVRQGLPAWMMMREGRHKYIRYLQQDTLEELYDLEQDPEEQVNLAVDPEYRQQLAGLRQRTIEEFRAQDGDFVDYLPEPKSPEPASQANQQAFE